MLYYTILYYTTLHYTIVYYAIMYYTILYYNLLLYAIIDLPTPSTSTGPMCSRRWLSRSLATPEELRALLLPTIHITYIYIHICTYIYIYIYILR